MIPTQMSCLEKLTCAFLQKHKIAYRREYTFPGLADRAPLRFDFYLPSLNTVIECQGQQHFSPVCAFGGMEAFKIQHRHDNLKRLFCRVNKIRLIELRYDEKDPEVFLRRKLRIKNQKSKSIFRAISNLVFGV